MKDAHEAAERIGQPSVLGELIAGVLLGSSVLGVVPSEGAGAEVIRVLAELGVLLLLFEIGLETDLREMFRVGPAALAVAVVGVTLPFALGYLYWRYAPHVASGNDDLVTAAIFIGATVWLVRRPTPANSMRVFGYSITYVTLLFAAITLDVLL